MDDLEVLSPGERLRSVRKELGLRQDDLSGKNLSKNYISMIENDKRRINIITASQLSERINKIAKKKGKDIDIQASYFIKNESDIAKDKCTKWLEDVEYLKNTNINEAFLSLYKVIYLSQKYDLNDMLAKAYCLKGACLHRNQLYECAIAHYTKGLVYFVKEDDLEEIREVYLNIANTCYMKKDYNEAINFYNLSGSLENNEENILYYKALCYYKLGEYKIAKSIIDSIVFKDNRCLKLQHNIKEKIKKA